MTILVLGMHVSIACQSSLVVWGIVSGRVERELLLIIHEALCSTSSTVGSNPRRGEMWVWEKPSVCEKAHSSVCPDE